MAGLGTLGLFRLTSDLSLLLHHDPVLSNEAATKAYVDGFLPLAGGTLTNIAPQLHITGASTQLTLDKTGATAANILQGQRNGTARWSLFLGNGTAEPGDGTGSDFQISRHNDAGTIGGPAAFTISRSSTQAVTISGPVTINNSLTVTGGISNTIGRINSTIVRLTSFVNATPADGDLWYDGTNLNFRKGATTVVVA
jgi:hypothetical protein